MRRYHPRMALSGKDKRALKARGQRLVDDIVLGKAGLTDAFIAHANDLLDRRELIKLRFGEDFKGDARKALAAEVEAALNAEVVQVLGRTMLLYRPNPQLDKSQRIL